MSAGGGTPYIGSKISLISKAQIRYEGILSSVDTERSTIALAKVNSYGTEDRHTDRPVPPKEEIYEYIIFRGSDIKDITVSEPPKPQPGLPCDPAIVQSSLGGPSVPYHPRWSPYRDVMPTYNQLAASSLLSQQYNTALGLVPGLHGLPARRAPMVEQAVQTVPSVSAGQRRGNALTRPQSKQPVCPSQRPRWDGSQTTADKTQGQVASNQKQKPNRTAASRRSRNRVRGQLLVKNSKGTTLKFESDFDFETANAQFNDDITKEDVGRCSAQSWKAGLLEKADSAEAPESPGMQEEEEEDFLGDKYYDKTKCFFDNISSDLKPRLMLLLRRTWAEEKKLNMETFGVPGRFLRGRGFRARGRGGSSTADQQTLPKIASGVV
uniref:LSM family member 14B n=1 Tax=Tetraodon nigroviridis TaxID=99883 RepID=H3C9Q2_TETNG